MARPEPFTQPVDKFPGIRLMEHRHKRGNEHVPIPAFYKFADGFIVAVFCVTPGRHFLPQ